ncbi:MAG: T9SS type A sorting domain-containing protein [Bacteroidia bacterium]|nr:T9SS type A sorting domain-containing protein [Bacteroidia bacterium]
MAFCTLHFSNVFSQSMFTNSSYETGTNINCNCPTSYICANDAGRVVSGFHPNFVVGNQGCIGGQNYFPPFGAHTGSCCVYFYAGLDRITTPNGVFTAGQRACVCVWYAGPQGSGASGQNTANSYFRIGVDGVGVSPNILVPVNTVWTQYCFLTAALTAGNHNFSIMSGGAAQYSIWNDDFEVNVCTVLPIELTNFDVHQKDGHAVIKWTTATETNNDFFSLEKSQNGSEFTILKIVGGAGNSNSELHYTVIDKEPHKGISYYRLKQTDKGGTYSYSQLVYLNSESEINLNVYPNPSDGAFKIDIGDDVENAEAILFDAIGREVYKVKVQKGINEINTENLMKGFYHLVLFKDNQKVYNTKIGVN